MVVKLVLNGGIKSCCSVTPTETVRKSVAGWLSETDELVVIDKEKEDWTPDSLAQLGQSYFQDRVFPLVYIDDTLAMVGEVPNREELLAMLRGEMAFGISENDILKAAKDSGRMPLEETAL